MVDQNSSLKKEAGIAERKLLARNERIQNLEALLQDADRRLSIQNQKFEAQLQAVKERLDQARGMPPCPTVLSLAMLIFVQPKRQRLLRLSISAVSPNPCVGEAAAVLRLDRLQSAVAVAALCRVCKLRMQGTLLLRINVHLLTTLPSC